MARYHSLPLRLRRNNTRWTSYQTQCKGRGCTNSAWFAGADGYCLRCWKDHKDHARHAPVAQHEREEGHDA